MNPDINKIIDEIKEKTISGNQLLIKITDYQSRFNSLTTNEKAHLVQIRTEHNTLITEINKLKHNALELHFSDSYTEKYDRKIFLENKNLERTPQETTEFGKLVSELEEMNKKLFK